MTRLFLIEGRSMAAESCCSCGIEFLVPKEFQSHCLEKGPGKSFYCPNGHSLSYKESETDKLRRERDLMRQQLAQKDDEISKEQSRALSAQKETERIKKRLHGGVCPCCSRRFSNLERHMKSKHEGKVSVLKLKAQS